MNRSSSSVWVVLVSTALFGCTTSVPVTGQANRPAPQPAVLHEDGALCDLVCEKAKLAVRPADRPDYTALALADADDVLSRMQPELLGCYKRRVAVAPNAHAFITVDVVIGPDGRVVQVETTGGALLGDDTMGCITGHIRRAHFLPPHNGGTLHLSVPFSLRRVAPGEG